MTASAVDPGRSRIILVGTPAYNDPALPNTPVVANNIADLHAVLTDPDLRVPGEGGRRRGFRKSDLLVSIEIAVPAEVSDLARQALRRYQEAMSWHAPRDRLFLEARR